MRLSPIDREHLSPAQQELVETIEQGPRGKARPGIGLIGPFGVWLRAPGIGRAAQGLGGAVRFGTSCLPENVKEVAICTVGAHYRSKFEFSAHRNLAITAGVAEGPLDQLANGDDPEFSGSELIAHAIASQMLNQHGILDETYNHGVDVFSEEGIVELVTTVGYYCLISLTLNSFQIPLEDGMVDPFPED